MVAIVTGVDSGFDEIGFDLLQLEPPRLDLEVLQICAGDPEPHSHEEREGRQVVRGDTLGFINVSA